MEIFRAPADICIAIFASRETIEVLSQTVEAAVVASPEYSSIDVLINGNSNLADEASKFFYKKKNSKNIRIRVWKIAYGDKANAWNQHIHQIWEGETLAFYIDGYVRLHPHAIKSLIETMAGTPCAFGGTGVPSVGRSAQMLRNLFLSEGGIHGNLCCIRGDTLTAFCQRKIRLPLGLYRTDSTMGAILSFGLDPTKFRWNPRHFIAVDVNATWETDKKRWWSFNDLKGALKRILRQARGRIENQAVRSHLAILKLSPETIPATVTTLVAEWAERSPEDAEKLIRSSFLLRRAMNELLTKKDWSQAEISPELM